LKKKNKNKNYKTWSIFVKNLRKSESNRKGATSNSRKSGGRNKQTIGGRGPHKLYATNLQLIKVMELGFNYSECQYRLEALMSNSV